MHIYEPATMKANPQHDAMLQIQQNLLLLAVVADQRVKRVAVRYPADKAGVCRQRNHRAPLNSTASQNSSSHFGQML